MRKFLDDLQLSPESGVKLIIGWKAKAATQCEFSRAEFINGMMDFGCDSIDMLRQRCSTMADKVKDLADFKVMYNEFTFNNAKNPGQKGIDMVAAYRRIFLQGRLKFVDIWCQFLSEHHKRSTAIPKDPWDLFRNFHYVFTEDFENYDKEASWSVFYDEFVEYMDQVEAGQSK